MAVTELLNLTARAGGAEDPDGLGPRFRSHGEIIGVIWVCLKIEKTPKPNGFADHYPY